MNIFLVSSTYFWFRLFRLLSNILFINYDKRLLTLKRVLIHYDFLKYKISSKIRLLYLSCMLIFEMSSRIYFDSFKKTWYISQSLRTIQMIEMWVHHVITAEVYTRCIHFFLFDAGGSNDLAFPCTVVFFYGTYYI